MTEPGKGRRSESLSQAARPPFHAHDQAADATGAVAFVRDRFRRRLEAGKAATLAPVPLDRAPCPQARTIADTFGLIGQPAAVLNASGEVLAANALFAALVPDTVRGMRGRPRFADADADRQIEDALVRRKMRSAGAHVRPIAVRGHGGRPPAIVQLIALPDGAEDVLAGSAGILAVTPVQQRPAPSPHILEQLFGLSRAEARVASGLAGRRTIAAMADAFGVSRETIRSQVKTVLVKTGMQRQLDLAVLLACHNFLQS
jgi:DNA-binding CsgD family transcriptional regulator